MKTEWEKQATNFLKAELKRKGLGYEELRLALEKIGVQKTVINLNKTINIGRFPFFFFLQCAKAIGLEEISLK